jgi:hypothetical protein
LRAEGLEDRMVLSSASLVGSTLEVQADPGRPGIVFGGHFVPPIVRQITIEADALHPHKVDVFDGAALLGQFPIASIKNVDVNLAFLDNVKVTDNNGLPFASGTTVSLSASSGLANSLTLTGNRIISGGETYVAGSGAQAGLLTLGGSTYLFGAGIGSVTDTVKTTAPLNVTSHGQGVGVTLTGSNGLTQTLSGLADGGGGGGTLTFGNKNLVDLELTGSGVAVQLNATAAAAGEKFFVVSLFGNGEDAFINATPANVDTNIVAASGGAVLLNRNSGRVDINGNSGTFVELGQLGGKDTTAHINADVFVTGVGDLLVADDGNATHTNVRVTESTVSGLFGNSAVALHYSNLAPAGPLDGLVISTGALSSTVTVAGSQPNATFEAPIFVHASAGSSVNVDVNLRSHLDLTLRSSDASLFIFAPNGTFNPFSPPAGQGIETVTFAGGLTSTVNYVGFNSVSVSNGIPHL